MSVILIFLMIFCCQNVIPVKQRKIVRCNMSELYSFLLSICIPTWNRADVLKKTVSELTASRSFEEGKVQIVISDNASDDWTEAVGRAFAEKFGARVKYFRHNTGIDPHFNFQHVLELGDGVFVKLQTDYVFYEPGELDKLIGLLEETKAENGVFLGGEKPGEKMKIVDSIEDILSNVSFSITSINNLFLRRALYDSLEDPFREWKSSFPQVDILLRLVERGEKVVILPCLKGVRQCVLNNRNHTMIFANYLDMLKKRVDNGILSSDAFAREKKKLLFNYLIPYHFDFFHQYNVSRRPLPFLPHCGHFKKEWYFVPALLWIGFMWFCSNVIPLHQLAGKIKRRFFILKK